MRSLGLALPLLASLALLAAPRPAWAGTITAQGNVAALDDIGQMPSIVGSALFDEMFNGVVPPDQYPGMTFLTGELTMMLPGVTAEGEVPDPTYTSPGIHFPYPIAGGGVQQGFILTSGGAVTFADPGITQFGMTVGGSATTYITVWDQNGMLLGQVTWEPSEGDAAFVGVDTGGVPIGLLAVGSDDVWGGVAYDDLGAAARSDTWMWGTSAPCQSETECLDDGWSCTAHACNAGACAYSNTTEPCDDADACTELDTCAEAQCIGTVVDCMDTNVCSFDSCDPELGCQNDPIEGCCLSDEDCPEGATCLVGSNTCVGGPPEDTGADTSGDTTTTTSGGDTTETDSGEETGAGASDDGGGCKCSTDADDRERAAWSALGLLALLGLRRRRSS